MDPAIPLAAIPLAAALGAVGAKVIGAARAKHKAKAREKEALASVDVERTQKDAALLIALGFDPSEARLRPMTKPWRGLRVEDLAGKPLRHFSERQLKQPDVRLRFKKALRRVQVSA